MRTKLLSVLILVLALFVGSACKSSRKAQSQAPKQEWVRVFIDSLSASNTRPAIDEVKTYLYKGDTVYMAVMPCCDRFNPVFDKTGNKICETGGFTGKGDGKCTDFGKEETTHFIRQEWTRVKEED